MVHCWCCAVGVEVTPHVIHPLLTHPGSFTGCDNYTLALENVKKIKLQPPYIMMRCSTEVIICLAQYYCMQRMSLGRYPVVASQVLVTKLANASTIRSPLSYPGRSRDPGTMAARGR